MLADGIAGVLSRLNSCQRANLTAVSRKEVEGKLCRACCQKYFGAVVHFSVSCESLVRVIVMPRVMPLLWLSSGFTSTEDVKAAEESLREVSRHAAKGSHS